MVFESLIVHTVVPGGHCNDAVPFLADSDTLPF